MPSLRITHMVWVSTLIIGWAAGWLSHAFIAVEPIQQQALHASNPAVPMPVTTTSRINTPAQITPTINNTQPDPLQIFHKLLMQKSFAAALSAWPTEREEQAQSLVLDEINALNQQNKPATALRLLKTYGDHFPEDIEAGLLHANVLHQQTQFDLEAFLLMELRAQTADSNSISRINRHLDNAIQSQKEYLTQAEKLNDLLNFYRQLSSLDGSNTDYQLMQAITLIDMGYTQQASTILQPLVFDPSAGNKAISLLQQIKNIHATDYQASIPLQRSGEHFLVPLSINGKAPILLLLDTGASITLAQIEPSDVSASDSTLSTITLQTANGRMDVPLVRKNQVKIGSFQLDNIDIALITKPIAASGKGLLGMNILKHFNFFIDQQTPALKLSPRSSHQ